MFIFYYYTLITIYLHAQQASGSIYAFSRRFHSFSHINHCAHAFDVCTRVSLLFVCLSVMAGCRVFLLLFPLSLLAPKQRGAQVRILYCFPCASFISESQSASFFERQPPWFRLPPLSSTLCAFCFVLLIGPALQSKRYEMIERRGNQTVQTIRVKYYMKVKTQMRKH